MSHDPIRDILRGEIVKKSIEILRAHGKGDGEIREMMLKDFSITEETLDQLLEVK